MKHKHAQGGNKAGCPRPLGRTHYWLVTGEAMLSSDPPGHSGLPCGLAPHAVRRALRSPLDKAYLRALGIQRDELQVSTAAVVHKVTVRQLKVKFRQILDTHLNVLPKAEKQILKLDNCIKCVLVKKTLSGEPKSDPAT